MRTPTTIALEARELLDKANKNFVPANLVRAMELNVEFMEATAYALGAAGIEFDTEPAAEA